MEELKKKEIITEYIYTLNQFREEIIKNDVKNNGKQWLISSLNRLSKMSVNIGELDIAQKLDNLSGGYKELEFFFPICEEMSESESETKLVLIISHELSRTGAPVVLFDAAKVLKDAGYYVLMISPMDGPLRNEIIKSGIPVIIDHHLLLGRCEQDYLREAHKYQYWPTDLLVRCSDVVIVNTACLHNAVERYMSYEKPIYWWLHEGNVSFEAFGDCLPKALTSNVHVLYVSEYVRKQMEASNIYYEGDILYYGVGDFAKEAKHSIVGKEDIVKFICVGAVCKRKGQDLLLDAINKLPIDYLKKSHFYFVGAPADQNLYNRIEMLGLGCDYITLCPSMPRENLIQFYEDIDFILCPSRDDPLPVVLTEMMILSKPCVVSEHTGTASLIEDGNQGYIVKNESVEELTQIIMKCIDHPEVISEMGSKSRKVYEEKLTMDVFKKNLLKLI